MSVRVTLPELYEKQYYAFFNDAHTAVCEATTKGGKTTGALVWQANEVLTDPLELNHWWVAPFHPQANIAYSRAKKMLRGVYVNKHDSDKWLRFRNGAVWWFKSAEKPDTLYGEDVASAVGDEFTRMRAEANTALVSTLTATEGKLRYIGNVKGRGWGYKLAREAEVDPEMVYTKITADDAVAAGVLSQRSIDRARKKLEHHVFRELYYCEPSDDGGNPFDMRAIEAAIGPRSDQPTAVYGIDLAMAIDFTVIIGLDANGQWTEFHRFQGKPWPETIEYIISTIRDRPAYIDETGLGRPILQAVQLKCKRAEGYMFSVQSKQVLMGGIKSALADRRISIPDGPTVSELQLFEYKETRNHTLYSAPDGAHDDCVYALGLAVHALNNLSTVMPAFTTTAPRDRRLDRFLNGGSSRSTSPLLRR